MKPTRSPRFIHSLLSCLRPGRWPLAIAILAAALGEGRLLAAPFAPAQEIGAFPASADWLEVADLDGDGLKDVLSVGPGTELRWFRQMDDHSFAAMPGLTLPGTAVLDAASRDVDANHRAELLVKVQNGSEMNAWDIEADQAGGLTGFMHYSANQVKSNERVGLHYQKGLGSPLFLYTTNHNGVGHVSFLYHDGFYSQSGTTTAPGPVASGCFRRGELFDYVVAAGSPERVRYFRYKGPEFFSHQAPIDYAHAYSPITELRAADFNRDGLDDLLIVASNTVSGDAHAISIRKSNGNGFDASSTVAAAALSHFAGVDAADIDEDGDPDVCALRVGLAAGGVAAPECTAYLNDGAGGFNQQLALAFPPGGRAMEIDDIDHDGDEDLLVLTNGGLSLFRNIAVQRAAHHVTTATTNVLSPPVDLVAFDVDDDRDDDICTAGSDGFLRFHEIENGAVVSTKVLTTLAQGTTDIASGDMDNDGRLDLVYVSESQDSIRWLNIPEPGGVLAKTTIASVTLPRGACVVDFDHDFDLDILTCSKVDASGEIVLCEHNPISGGDWKASTLVPNVPDGFRVWGGHLFQHPSNAVVVQTSNGAGSAVHYFVRQPYPSPVWDKVTLYESPYPARDLKVGDLNGDGRPDILAGDAGGARYWLNTGSSFGSPAKLLRVPDGRMALTDLNGNADLDAAFASDSDVCWTRDFPGALGGQPSPEDDLSITSTANNLFVGLTHVVAGDFNRDGIPDLGVASGSADLHLLTVQRGQATIVPGLPAPNAAVAVAPGKKVVALSLTVDSEGRPNDAGVQLNKLVLRFTKDSQGVVPMTATELTQILSQVQVSRASSLGSPDFAPGAGVPLLTHIPVPAGNVVTVPLELSPMPLENFVASPNEGRRFLVTLLLKPTAAAAGVTDFWVWHADGPSGPRTSFVHSLPGAVPAAWPADWLTWPSTPKQQITIRNLTALEAWRETHFGYHLSFGEGADDHDADGDGSANLVEYAQATLPKSVTSVRRLDPQLTAAGKPQIFFSLASPQPADIRVQVQSSSTLANATWVTRAERITGIGWSGSLLPVPSGIMFQGVQMWSLADANAALPEFYRLRVLVVEP